MQINYRIQTHEYNTLAITTELLNTLNELAIEREYNRALYRGFFPSNIDENLEDTEKTERVILEGFPIRCELAMPHYHAGGKLVMPHVRAVFKVPTVSLNEIQAVEAQVKDVNLEGFSTLKWETVTIDIPGETWESLPTIKPYAWVDVPEVPMYEQAIYMQANKKFEEDANATIEDVEKYLAQTEKDFFNRMGEEE